MEDFAAKEQKGIKEKNLYILHLDTPRIIILSSVIIGLIIISVLIGMNVNKHDQKDLEGLSRDNAVLDNLVVDNSEKTSLQESNSIEPSLSNENLLKNQENYNSNIIAENSIKPQEKIVGTQNNSQKGYTGAAKDSGNNASDILTHENIETIIQPANTLKKTESRKVIKKSHEKQNNRPKDNKRRRGIVEVSSKEKPDKSINKDKNYFSIQVAAFDKKSKAVAEVNKLETQKYNAYLDSANINNKTFYRVMIGPIDSKKKAADLLNEISANNRYGESYIIKR